MSKKHHLLLLCIFALTISCKRNLTANSSDDKFNRLDFQAFDFQYLRGKAKVNYLENNERENAKINIRIKKDSVIWIQIAGVGGLEGGRVLISLDSLIMIDRINKEIYEYSYLDLSERYKFDINYHLLQAMLLGNMPFDADSKDRVTRQVNHFLVKQKYDNHVVDNLVSRTSQRLEKVVIEQQSTKNTLNMDYQNFNTVNNILFPFNSAFSLKYNNNNKTLFTEIGLEFTKAEIPEKPLKFPFSIPEKYARNY